ncbi:MAG TPA: response regulator, partial [Leptospiraceae bacterium]|nr:response regulator [Leptospiraceae bacterium]
MKNVILIVDDENDVREMFIKFLEKKGFDTVAASDALSAMRALKRGGIDLVLSDYQMPEMTGIELLQEIFKMHPT